MASDACDQRLVQERKNWRRDRPFGFVAKPHTRPDGSCDLRLWECAVPGPEGSDWAGGLYPLTLAFGDDYPAAAPTARFEPGLLHPNVYPDGKVCLSILNDDPDMGGQWAPSVSIKQVLKGIQELLVTPNDLSPAQVEAWELHTHRPAEYRRRVLQQAKKYAAPK
ncbi:ubiquitin-conjugating enzyme E2 I [Haematococcus lacustris]